MDSQNPYQSPQSDVGVTGQYVGVTDTMARVLASGAFWARLLSVLNFIALAFLVLSVLFTLFLGLAGGSAYSMGMSVGNILGSIPYLFVYWFYGIAMHRYAGAAKRLRSSDDIHDAAICFASFSTYLKVTGVLFIILAVIFVIGILAAVVLPLLMN